MRTFILLCFSMLQFFSLLAKNGYQIELKLDNFENNEIIFASYYGASNQVIDTFAINKKGKFIIKGKQELKGGSYLVILPPDNNFFELIIDKEQSFSLSCDVKNHIPTMKIKGSEENRLFYEYLNFISQKQKEKKNINEALKATEKKNEKELLEQKNKQLNQEVTQYFDNIITQYPHNIISIIINAVKPSVELPEHLNQADADATEKYLYYKRHYFNNFDRGDERLLRTNFFLKRVDYYLDKLTPQIPDSIAVSIDYILSPMKKDGDSFKYYLVHILNKYAKSKVVGMDAVYVYIVNNYYSKGYATWTDTKTLEKIKRNANELTPILIGKQAPNMTLLQRDGKELTLYDVATDYIVLYFWDPDCGHCKKASPNMIAFNDKFKDQGVQLLGICTEIRDEVKKCWETIDDRSYNWLNVVDPYLKSGYKTLYNIKSTPQIFILDKDKKIIMKRIGAEQLEDVMTKIIEKSNHKSN